VAAIIELLLVVVEFEVFVVDTPEPEPEPEPEVEPFFEHFPDFNSSVVSQVKQSSLSVAQVLHLLAVKQQVSPTLV